jgi:hypothetical protein
MDEAASGRPGCPDGADSTAPVARHNTATSAMNALILEKNKKNPPPSPVNDRAMFAGAGGGTCRRV